MIVHPAKPRIRFMAAPAVLAVTVVEIAPSNPQSIDDQKRITENILHVERIPMMQLRFRGPLVSDKIS
jgi:hypothetical protein